MVFDASLLNTQHYKVRIKGKVEQSREGVAPSPTHWCSSYRKGSPRVTLDFYLHLYSVLIIIIIIMSHYQHGYPWPSLVTPPYRSSLLTGLQGYIPYPHRAAVCMFELTVLPLFGHICTSLMSSSRLLQQCPACLVRLTWIVFLIGGKWPYSWCFVGCCLHDLTKLNCLKWNCFWHWNSTFTKLYCYI